MTSLVDPAVPSMGEEPRGVSSRRRPTRAARGVMVIVGVALVVSWTLFATLVLPHDYRAGTATFGAGLAVTAFMLGLRHAFDADHIAAIDNTSRKLVADGRDPSSVGLWFAVGHSTVVLLAVGLVTAGAGAVTAQIGVDDSPLAKITGVWGPTVSSVFLLAMAVVNLTILVRVIRGARRAASAGSAGDPGGSGSSDPDAARGPVMALIARTSATLDAPWKMFLVGFLFGLGFDTASTITLLLIAGGAGIAMPWYAAMVLPLLFTAGMLLGDGTNGVVTAGIYRWSADRPHRRRRYNAALLCVSVAVAFLVGAVGLCGVLVDAVGVRWAPVQAIAATNLDSFGLIIVGVIVTAWFTSWILSRVHTARVG